MGSIELYSSMCFVPSLQSVVSLLEVMQHNHLWSQNDIIFLFGLSFPWNPFYHKEDVHIDISVPGNEYLVMKIVTLGSRYENL